MKYVIFVGDGMADRPIKELGGRTPLEAARTPAMDSIAREGLVGLVHTIPRGMNPGTDIAMLSVLGYDPKKYFTGRGPLEAVSLLGLWLRESQIAFRCNLVTVSDGKLIDYSGGHVRSEEAHLLIDAVNKELGCEAIKFFGGVGYRHIMIIDEEAEDFPQRVGIPAEDLCSTLCFPPHDVVGEDLRKIYPKGRAEKFLIELMEESLKILDGHEVNQVRRDLGENPANMIWLWGQGKAPALPTLEERFGVRGAVISAVDVVNGIGKYAGLEIIRVPGATGFLDTNYEGKAEHAIRALEDKDFVLVHVEAPDEAGHMGDWKAKIRALEDFDKKVVGTVLEAIRDMGAYRAMVISDHPTPVSVKTHTREPVPFAMCGDGLKGGDADEYNEKVCANGINLKNGEELAELFFKVG